LKIDGFRFALPTLRRLTNVNSSGSLRPLKSLAATKIKKNLSVPSKRLSRFRISAHTALMADFSEAPVILPFRDKEGTGWHVVIRYHEGHERRVDGFATESEALDWIIANASQVDK
jgi:hypothetical protein